MFELDIPSISAIVAAAGVLVGVILTVLELRHLVKQRKTELVTRLSSEFSTSRQFLEAFVDTLEVEFKDYDDFVKRYGKPISKKEVPMSFMTMGNFFEEIGTLYRNKLIDASLINQIFPISEVWEKMKPLVEGMRKEYHFPTLFDQFEYLYYEMRKREQKLQQSKA
jgi:hypothetical protein